MYIIFSFKIRILLIDTHVYSCLSYIDRKIWETMVNHCMASAKTKHAIKTKIVKMFA